MTTPRTDLIDALYNVAPIILWVEDELTKIYLNEVWNAPTIGILVGGGHEIISAVVEDAKRRGRDFVFGLRDRDFGPTNRPRWNDPTTKMFTLETFEVECFLLDPQSIAACDLNTSTRADPEIQQKILQIAQDFDWWMACRHVISNLREARQTDFPSHPKPQQINNQQDAQAFLLNSPWITTTVPLLSTQIAASKIQSDLQANQTFYQNQIQANNFCALSGKEIYNQIITWIWTKRRPKRNLDITLAKSIAAAQITHNAIPKELEELRNALLARLP